MKKVAVIFVLAVLLPSLVLAWLAVRSLRDQQFLLEHQQAQIDQRATDTLAQAIADYLAQRQQEFSAQVESLVTNQNPRAAAADFDTQLRERWPLAEVGFCVTLSGKILSPPPNARPEAQMFRLDNSGFLGNHEPVEVYWNANAFKNGAPSQSFALNGFSTGIFGQGGSSPASSTRQLESAAMPAKPPATIDSFAAKKWAAGTTDLELKPGALTVSAGAVTEKIATGDSIAMNSALDRIPLKQQLKQPKESAPDGLAGELPVPSQFNYSAAQPRKVSPQNARFGAAKNDSSKPQSNLSRVVPAEAEFAQLIGDQTDGMFARFLQNKLQLMFWHRLNRAPDLIFGAELNLNRIVDGLRHLVQPDPASQNDLCLALLNDNAKPVALSRANFSANWKRPFVATEIGEALPHWEVAAYLVNPAQLTQAARTAELTLGLLITVLVLAIGVGSWLIVSSLNSELKLARQKTDFVSNVSHELKTPLTSIRMFSELLAENRVADPAKQRSYLQIITAEAARLTRLINNVLDFSRLENGEKKYHFQSCDLIQIVRATAETFRPHLAANDFKFDCEWPETKIFVRGDADALSQIIVNLLSNAEKYSNDKKEITVQLAQKSSPLPHAEINILDRGSGVPSGSAEKIFEKFYRAHDSLSSGIQGSGLGLTIARQIARAHGGDVIYEPRAGGGSRFILRLPILTTDKHG